MQHTLDLADILLRLIVAVIAGMAIGADREWRGKEAGIRTLALVSLGSALVCVATIHLASLDQEPDALSRVIQGVIQGVMTGIGFLGAGAVLQRPREGQIEGLTTAATVWVTAAIGIACGLASWDVVAAGVGLTLVVLIVLYPIDRWVNHLRARRDARTRDRMEKGQ